jgi:hypothetical protein
MKDKIIDFIKKVKAVFSERRNSMPPVRFHKPHIEAIATDELSLESAAHIIETLDESDHQAFAASALYYFIEKVIPIFRNWKNRIDETSQAHNRDVQGHIKAKEQHDEFKKTVQTLLVEINMCDDQPLIAVDLNVQNPGIAIVKRYESEKEQYLQTHSIQKINENEGNLLSTKKSGLLV